MTFSNQHVSYCLKKNKKKTLVFIFFKKSYNIKTNNVQTILEIICICSTFSSDQFCT